MEPTTAERTTVLLRKGRDREIMLMQPALFKFHRYLLVLAHARCFSTVLCHILGSHPKICGYSEAMIPYETPVDLIRLNAEVFKAGNYRPDSEYVLDKILYNNFSVSEAVLGSSRVVPMFLVREPAAAIASHVRQRIREQQDGINDWGPEGADLAWNTEVASIYYIQRVKTLQVIGQRLEAMGKRGLFLTADELMDNTAATFRFLERELGLDEPLREEYRVFKDTGTRGSGDTSPMIRSGRIVRDRDGRTEEPVPIPRDFLDTARQVYVECLAAFRASPAMARVGDDPAGS